MKLPGFFFFFIILIGLVSAAEYQDCNVYGVCITKAKGTTFNNATANVNNSNYLQGYTPSTYITSVLDTTYIRNNTDKGYHAILKNLSVLDYNNVFTRGLVWNGIDANNDYLNIGGAVKIGLRSGSSVIESIDGTNDQIVLRANGSGQVILNYDSGTGGATIFDGGVTNYCNIKVNSNNSCEFNRSLNNMVYKFPNITIGLKNGIVINNRTDGGVIEYDYVYGDIFISSFFENAPSSVGVIGDLYSTQNLYAWDIVYAPEANFDRIGGSTGSLDPPYLIVKFINFANFTDSLQADRIILSGSYGRPTSSLLTSNRTMVINASFINTSASLNVNGNLTILKNNTGLRFDNNTLGLFTTVTTNKYSNFAPTVDSWDTIMLSNRKGNGRVGISSAGNTGGNNDEYLRLVFSAGAIADVNVYNTALWNFNDSRILTTTGETGFGVAINSNIKLNIAGENGATLSKGQDALYSYGGTGGDCTTLACSASAGGNNTLVGGVGGTTTANAGSRGGNGGDNKIIGGAGGNGFGSDFTGLGGNGGSIYLDGGTAGGGFTSLGTTGNIYLGKTTGDTYIQRNNAKLYFGTSSSSYISYTGAGNLELQPMAVGSGYVLVKGTSGLAITNTSAIRLVYSSEGENLSRAGLFSCNNAGQLNLGGNDTCISNRFGNGILRFFVNNGTSGNAGEIEVLKISNTSATTNVTWNFTNNVNIVGNLTVKIPYAVFTDNTTQPMLSTTSGQPMNFSITEDSYMLSIVNKQNITVKQIGDYHFIVSALGKCTNNNKHINIWWQKNGVNVVRSNTLVELPTANVELDIVVPFIIDLNATDNLRIMWNADDTGCSLIYYTNSTVPLIPETPSVILTINRIGDITE